MDDRCAVCSSRITILDEIGWEGYCSEECMHVDDETYMHFFGDCDDTGPFFRDPVDVQLEPNWDY